MGFTKQMILKSYQNLNIFYEYMSNVMSGNTEAVVILTKMNFHDIIQIKPSAQLN
jgi:hypothetical protein